MGQWLDDNRKRVYPFIDKGDTPREIDGYLVDALVTVPDVHCVTRQTVPRVENGLLFVPQDVSGQVTFRVYVDFLNTSAGYRNEFGLVVCDDETGAVSGVAMTDHANYAQTVLSSPAHAIVFPRFFDRNATFEVTLNSGQWVNFFLVQNQTASHFLSRNPTNSLSDPDTSCNVFFPQQEANPDDFPHFDIDPLEGFRVRYGVEDLDGGGDEDFDDFIFVVEAATVNDQDCSQPLNESRVQITYIDLGAYSDPGVTVELGGPLAAEETVLVGEAANDGVVEGPLAGAFKAVEQLGYETSTVGGSSSGGAAHVAIALTAAGGGTTLFDSRTDAHDFGYEDTGNHLVFLWAADNFAVKLVFHREDIGALTWPQEPDRELVPSAVYYQRRGLTEVVANGIILDSTRVVTLAEGCNTSFTIMEQEEVGGETIEVVQVSYEPGAGEGRCRDCGENVVPIYRINGVRPDSLGNFQLGHDNCFVMWPTHEAEADGAHGLFITSFCEPCCVCDDFVALYEQVKEVLDDNKTGLEPRLLNAREFLQAGIDAFNFIRENG